MKNAWTFTGTDEVGKIYRIRDPTYADAIQVVAENAEVSVPEGGTAVARFKLAVAASLRATGGVPAVTALVASVTFTPQDWDQWHEVPLSAADDDIDKVASGHLVCGAGNPAALIATSVKVTPVNNGLHGATTNTLAAYEGPAGLGALQAGSVVRAPDYDGKLDRGAVQRLRLVQGSYAGELVVDGRLEEGRDHDGSERRESLERRQGLVY